MNYQDKEKYCKTFNVRRCKKCCGNCRHFERDYKYAGCAHPKQMEFDSFAKEVRERNPEYSAEYGAHLGTDVDEGMICDLWEMKGESTITPETNEATNDPIIYQVMILSRMYCTPLYPYIGKDKETAIAIATAYIAKGETTTTINEIKAYELKAHFDRENKNMGEILQDSERYILQRRDEYDNKSGFWTCSGYDVDYDEAIHRMKQYKQNNNTLGDNVKYRIIKETTRQEVVYDEPN